MAKRKVLPHHRKLFILKEVVLGLLAVSSIILVLYEFLYEPDEQTLVTLNHIDIVIACIFLTDFCASLLLTSDRKKYLRHNWYFLFAAIPITDSIAELLRGIRVLRLVRLIRAGEHLDYSVTRK
ncbi:MAG: voltage-gated potassium channel [Patescibacteria group bacterium]|nr:voltage-gated potassium channel [Patescibacteria group bacterium]